MFIDLCFILILIIGCLKGYQNGLIMGLFSFFAFFAGMAAALKLSAFTASLLSGQDNQHRWLPVLSFLLVFLLVAFIVKIIGRILRKTFQVALLGWADRLGGLLLYCSLFLFIYMFFLFFAVQLNIIGSQAISQSVVYPYLDVTYPGSIKGVQKLLPFFKDLFYQLQDFFAVAAGKIQD